jgi:hypothetical protein
MGLDNKEHWQINILIGSGLLDGECPVIFSE